MTKISGVMEYRRKSSRNTFPPYITLFGGHNDMQGKRIICFFIWPFLHARGVFARFHHQRPRLDKKNDLQKQNTRKGPSIMKFPIQMFYLTKIRRQWLYRAKQAAFVRSVCCAQSLRGPSVPTCVTFVILLQYIKLSKLFRATKWLFKTFDHISCDSSTFVKVLCLISMVGSTTL